MYIKSAQEFVDICQTGDGTPIPYHVDAPVEVWHELILMYPELRETIAGNKTIPEEIIRQLALDEDNRVRWSIACKRKTPTDILELLANDSDESVRNRVLFNPKVTLTILEKMLDDESDEIRETAGEKLKKLRERKESSGR